MEISLARKPAIFHRLPVCIAVLGWLFICAVALRRAADDPNPFSLVVCAVLLLAPVLLRNIKRLPIYLLAVYAVLVPFNDLLNTSSGPTITRLLAIVTGGCLVFSMLAFRRISKPSKVPIVLLCLTVYLGATVLWAIDPSKALQAYGAYLSYVFLFVVISFYSFSLNDMKLVLAATLFGALLQSAYGDSLFLHGQEMAGTRLYIGYAAEHSIDPNAFATGLLVPIALTLVLFLRCRFGLVKLCWLAASLTVFSGFLLSASRGAAVALLVMAVFLTWRTRHRIAFVAISAILLILMFASTIGQRFMQSDVGNADGRIEVWKVGIASLRQYWLTGAGIGNFGEAFSQYYLTTPHMWLAWDRVAHSVLIQGLVEYGVIGFVLLMALWYVLFRDLAAVADEGVFGDICIALRAGVLGLFVAGFSLDLMAYKYTWLAFSLVAILRSTLIGMGVPVDRPKRVRTSSESESSAALTMPLAQQADAFGRRS